MTKFTNGFAVISICLLCQGCYQPPDFTEEVKVRSKKEYEDYAIYALQHDQGMLGSGWGAVRFMAPKDFADAGDSISFTNGCLRAK